MEEIRRFWDVLKSGEYEVASSSLALDEIDRDKQGVPFGYLSEIVFYGIEETPESIALSLEYLKRAVLANSSRLDCEHIALACT